MSPEDLRDRIRNLSQVHWHHTLRLLPDVIVNCGKSADTLAAKRAANRAASVLRLARNIVGLANRAASSRATSPAPTPNCPCDESLRWEDLRLVNTIILVPQ